MISFIEKVSGGSLRTRLFATVVVLSSLAAIASSILIFVGGAGASSAQERALSAGRALGAQAYYQHGELTMPAALATRTAQLNDALDSCYLANGATHVPFDNGGYTYDDPNGVAKSACAARQAAVDAYAQSPEMAGFNQGVQPLANAFWSCLQGAGVLPASDLQRANTRSASFVAAADRCSAKANSSVGVVAQP